MHSVSVVISAYNAESTLAQCLDSVTWADEIIVVDNESTDKTSTIAKKYGAKVFSQPNRTMLNTNKNFGFEKASAIWILNLDADEEVSAELQKEIQEIITNNSEENGYWIPRKNIIFGKWIQHGLWWPDKQLRLFKKGNGKFPCVHVHEYIEVNGKTAELTAAMTHHNYQTVSQFLRKLDTIYTENEVENRIKEGYRVSWRDAITWPTSDFVKVYFAQHGYKDGLHGLVLAMLQSCYAFVMFAKLWEKAGFTEKEIRLSDVTAELKKSQQEQTYWMITSQLSTTTDHMKRLMLRIKRKYVTPGGK